MLKIGTVVEKYNLSHRALHYWEKSGLLTSQRSDNGYRYYDEQNHDRIRHIMKLRQLGLQIKDIAAIFNANNTEQIVGVLNKYLNSILKRTKQEILCFNIIARLITLVENNGNFCDSLMLVDFSEKRLPSANRLGSSQINENEEFCMDIERKEDLRIISLPKMAVAAFSSDGGEPEDECWREVLGLIAKHKLNEEYGFRNFGFGYYGKKGRYVYEIWVSVPQDFAVPPPFTKKVFQGGLFAGLSTNLRDISEDWQSLHDKVSESRQYRHDTSPSRDIYLEECLDLTSFHADGALPEERQLDLLLPIKKSSVLSRPALETESVSVEEIVGFRAKLVGGTYRLRENASVIAKSVPWYKLAKSLYASNVNLDEYLFEPNNTFSVFYPKNADGAPFFLQKGYIGKVFGAVELKKPFPKYDGDLSEFDLCMDKCLKFSVSIDPSLSKEIRLSAKLLYKKAEKYIKDNGYATVNDFCVEKDFRADNRYTDKIELYIAVK